MTVSPLVVSALWALMVLGSVSLGRAAWKLFARDSASPNIGYEIALGLGVLGYFVYAIGRFGYLRYEIILVILLSAAIPAAAKLIRTLRFKGDRKSGFWIMAEPVLAGAAALLFLSSLSPKIDHDALCYHLYLARVYSESGIIGSLPTHLNSDWPLLAHSLFAAAYTLGGLPLTKLIQATALLAMAFICRQTLKSWGSGDLAARIASWTLVLCPLAVNQAASPYVDLLLALFAGASVLLAIEWIGRPHGFGLLVLSAVLMGFAFSVKYLAAIALLALLAVLLVAVGAKRVAGQTALRAVFVYASVVLVTGGYWYVLSWQKYGNPIHPYFGHLFSGIDYLAHYETSVSKSVWGWVKVLFLASHDGQALTGYSERLGPLFIAFAPFAFMNSKDRFKQTALTVFILIYGAIWFAMYQNLRFLTPILIPSALMAGLGFDALKKTGGSLKAAAYAYLIFCIGLLVPMAVYRHSGEIRSIATPPEEYYSHNDRAFAIARFINQRYGFSAVVAPFNEVHFYYFKSRIIRPNLALQSYPRRLNLGLSEGVSLLRSQGVNLILVYDDGTLFPPAFESTLLRSDQGEREALGIRQVRVPDGAGIDQKYLLFEI